MSDGPCWGLVNSGDKHVPEIEGRRKLSSKVVSSIALVALAACAANKSPYVIGAAGPWKQGYGLQNLQGVQLAVLRVVWTEIRFQPADFFHRGDIAQPHGGVGGAVRHYTAGRERCGHGPLAVR